MMRKGMCTAALCALLMSGAAAAAEERDAVAPEQAPAAAEAAPAANGAAAAGEGSEAAGGAFARMPPGADPLPQPAAPPLAEEGAVAVPEGNGTNLEAPAEDRAGDEAPVPAPGEALPAPGESAGSRI